MIATTTPTIPLRFRERIYVYVDDATTNYNSGTCLYNYNPEDTSSYRSQSEDSFDDFTFLAGLNREWKEYKAKWILREGPFMRFDASNILPITKAIRFRKILRCNRKGTGLRLGRDK